MEKVYDIVIDAKLYKKLKDYCDLNGFDVNEYANRLLKESLMIDKYGNVPEPVAKKQTTTVKHEEQEKVKKVVRKRKLIESVSDIKQEITPVEVRANEIEKTNNESKPKKRTLN